MIYLEIFELNCFDLNKYIIRRIKPYRPYNYNYDENIEENDNI